MGFRLGPGGRRKGLEGPKGPGTLGGSWGRFEMKGDCLRLGGTCGRPITGWLVIGRGPEPRRGGCGGLWGGRGRLAAG